MAAKAIPFPAAPRGGKGPKKSKPKLFDDSDDSPLPPDGGKLKLVPKRSSPARCSPIEPIVWGEIQYCPWDLVHPSPLNVRKVFPEDDIANLSEQIRTLGLKEPLCVRPAKGKGKGFELVDGERRYRAIGMLPKSHSLRKSVPVRVGECTDEQVMAVMLFTRTESRDLLVSELVAGYTRLATDAAGQTRTADEIGKLVGEKTAAVRQVLRLARLPDYVLQHVDSGKLPRATAELIARVSGDETRDKVARIVLRGNEWWSPREGVPTITEIQQRDGEPLSYRKAKELMRSHFQIELKQARFNLQTVNLIPNVGTCKECPDRAGNNEEAIADGIRADMCLNPDCFRAKTKAYGDRELRIARDEGLIVMEPEEAKNVFNNDAPYYFVRHSDYLDLEAESWSSGTPRTHLEMLGKRFDPKYLILAQDPSGVPRRLISRQIYDGLVQRLGNGKTKFEPEKSVEEQKKERAAQSLDNKIGLQTLRRYMQAVYRQANRFFGELLREVELIRDNAMQFHDAKLLLQFVTKHVLHQIWNDQLRDLGHSHGWLSNDPNELRKQLAEFIDNATPAECLALCLERLMPNTLSTDTLQREELESALGVSSDEIKQEVTAELTKKGKKLIEAMGVE